MLIDPMSVCKTGAAAVATATAAGAAGLQGEKENAGEKLRFSAPTTPHRRSSNVNSGVGCGGGGYEEKGGGGGGSCPVNAFDLMPPPMPRTPGGGGGKGQQQQQQRQACSPSRSPVKSRSWSSAPVSPLGQHDPNRRQAETTDHVAPGDGSGGGGGEQGKFGRGRVEKRADVKVRAGFMGEGEEGGGVGGREGGW